MRYKKTKIVCTIGPASSSRTVMKYMIQAGMDVARLNFSHGSHEEKRTEIQTLRSLSAQLDKPIAIVADLQGPKLRLGAIDGVVDITKGQILRLSHNTLADALPTQFDLAPFIKKGERLFLNDGLVELLVLEVKDGIITAKANNGGWISANKGMNVPDTLLEGIFLTKKDIQDAVFALQEGVDYLALSFVQTAEDVKRARELVRKYNPITKVIVKIEMKEAITNIESIIDETDAVMIARGDLAIETSAAEVPILQQKITTLCREYQKPVIVATHMLESMTNNPRPTRAEASDVANAVMRQVDAVMLSAESAAGKYPVEAVQTMSDIILSVEQNTDYRHAIAVDWKHIAVTDVSFNAIVSSAAALAKRIMAPLIAVATATGRSAKLMSSFRPEGFIVAVTHDEKTSNQLSLLWGVYPIIVKPTKNTDAFWNEILKAIHEHRLSKSGEKIVMIGGTIVGVSGATDTIKVVTV